MSTAPVPTWRANGVLITMAVGGLALVTNETLPFGLINLMATDLGRSQSEIGLLVTGYALVVVIVSIPLVVLTRRIPRRYLLTATYSLWALGAALAATSSSYPMLLTGRLLTAFSQSMWWAVVTATVAGLFAAEIRGKVVSRMLIGPAAAGVLGLPTLTWLGQQTQWRTPFWVLTGVGVALAIATVILVPSYRPDQGAAARGTTPNVRRFVMLMGITMLGVLGLMIVFTYITPFLNEVTGFAESVIPFLLVSQGSAGIVGMLVVGRFIDRYPRSSLAVGLGIIAVAWLGLGLFSTSKPLAAGFFIFMGFGFSTMVAGLMNRVMQLSPGSTDLGVATYSTLYNSGIALGSWVGASVLASTGAAPLPWIGMAALLVALAMLASTNWIAGASLRGRMRSRSLPSGGN